MLKLILKYIGYFMAVASAVSLIGGIAWAVSSWVGKQEDKANKTGDLEVIVNRVSEKQDSVLFYINTMRRDVTGLKRGQAAIVNSFALHLTNDKSVTKEDLLEFLQQFEQKSLKKNSELSTYRIPYAPK
jgi:uncharacterized protein YqeY